MRAQTATTAPADVPPVRLTASHSSQLRRTSRCDIARARLQPSRLRDPIVFARGCRLLAERRQDPTTFPPARVGLELCVRFTRALGGLSEPESSARQRAAVSGLSVLWSTTWTEAPACSSRSGGGHMPLVSPPLGRLVREQARLGAWMLGRLLAGLTAPRLCPGALQDCEGSLPGGRSWMTIDAVASDFGLGFGATSSERSAASARGAETRGRTVSPLAFVAKAHLAGSRLPSHRGEVRLRRAHPDPDQARFAALLVLRPARP